MGPPAMPRVEKLHRRADHGGAVEHLGGHLFIAASRAHPIAGTRAAIGVGKGRARCDGAIRRP
jgi:hypothetical protein